MQSWICLESHVWDLFFKVTFEVQPFCGAISLNPLQLVIAHVNGSALIGGLLMPEWIYAAQISHCSGGVIEKVPDRMPVHLCASPPYY